MKNFKTIIHYLKLMRFHKPVGILLLLWPTLWALWLANHGIPPLRLLVIFVLGTVVMRAAGCVINDIADRNFDRYVERTKTRPLTAGAISLKSAIMLLIILAFIALGLVVLLNTLCFVLACIAAALTILYPYTKRFTYFPQVILGLAFAMAVPIAYAASLNALPLSSWLVFLLAVLWPLMYDTAYAITDYPDDIKIGIKSTAVRFKTKSSLFIAVLQILLLIGFILLGLLEHLHWVYFAAVFFIALLFGYQQQLLLNNKAFSAFLNNQWVGFVLWLGIVSSYVVTYGKITLH